MAAVPNASTRVANAYYEAGYAVAAIITGIELGLVTIVGEDNAVGFVRHLRPVRSLKTMHNRGIVALAGEAAQRHYSPSSVREHHGADDRKAVVHYAFACVSSSAQANLLVRLWQVQAMEFVAGHWAAIECLAQALLDRETLTQAEAWAVIKVSQATTAARS